MNGSELDFWLGSWDARWEGGDGTNDITRELGGKVVVERFEGRPSLELTGLSVSVFDAEADLWRQTWVDDQGGYFALTGGKRRRRIRAPHVCRARRRAGRAADGLPGHRADSFRWLWERSLDGGASWLRAGRSPTPEGRSPSPWPGGGV